MTLDLPRPDCIYKVLLCDAQNGKVNWVSRLKNLLETSGFGHVWLYQSVENDKLFFRIFNQRIQDNYGQRLHFELQNMSRENILFYYIINISLLQNTLKY